MPWACVSHKPRGQSKETRIYFVCSHLEAAAGLRRELIMFLRSLFGWRLPTGLRVETVGSVPKLLPSGVVDGRQTWIEAQL